MEENFEWDSVKALANRLKHGVSFETAKRAFEDPSYVVSVDQTHSATETRYYCYGKVDERVLTVRFTYRAGRIRIIGAGYWRYGKRHYEKENSLH